MEYFLIEEYQIAINYLDKYYTCGVNLGRSHYSGNFWWARNDYLNKLHYCPDRYLYCEHNFLEMNKYTQPHKMLHKTLVQWPDWLKKRYPRIIYTNKPQLI